MSGLILTVTNAGRAALVNLPNTGTNAVLMASVGVSATSFTPTAATTALPGEIKRISTVAGEAVANDTIHVTVQDESSAVYTVRSFGLYLSDGTLFAVYSQANPIMEKSAQAMLLLAIDVAFADIDATQITFGDTSFLNPPATTERQGVVELATDAEATTGNDATRAITPRAMKAAVTSWLNTRLGNGAPSDFIKGLLTSASAAVLRASLELKSAALKDEGAGKGLDADLLDGQHGSYYSNVVARLGYTPWGPANDGSGSGLDADLLDGEHASAFAKLSGAAFTGDVAVAGIINISGAGIQRTGTPAGTFFGVETNGNWLMKAGGGTFRVQNAAGTADIFSATPGGTFALGSQVWTASTDGSGSGLDADLLDGLQATGFVQRVGNAQDIFTTSASEGSPIKVREVNLVGANQSASIYAPRLKYAWGGRFIREFGMDYAGVFSAWSEGATGYAPIRAEAFYAGANIVWNAGNDGSGSGLDADLLDGQHASEFAQLSGASFTGSVGVGGAIYLSGAGLQRNGTPAGTFFGVEVNGNWLMKAGGGLFRLQTSAGDEVFQVNPSGAQIMGSPLWSASNDGSGSGLDADLLDGQQGSYYLPAASYSAADVKAKLLTVDGSGSGLDADLLDGEHASAFAKLSGAAFTGDVSVAGIINISGAGLQRIGSPAGTFFGVTPSGQWIARGESLAITNFAGTATFFSVSPVGAYRAGNTIWDAGTDGSGSGLDADMLDGLHASSFQRVTSQNMAALNGYRVYADGTKECWTSLTIAQHSNATWTLPVAHTEFVHPSFAISTANGITDVQDNTGITSINGAPPVSITFWNADNRTITIWVRTIGR